MLASAATTVRACPSGLGTWLVRPPGVPAFGGVNEVRACLFQALGWGVVEVGKAGGQSRSSCCCICNAMSMRCNDDPCIQT